MVDAGQLLDRVQHHLVDPDGRTWSRERLRHYLTDAQRALVGLRPEAYTVSESVQLEPGVRQELPKDGTWIVDVVRNLGSDGETPRRVIREVSRKDLDAASPRWPEAKTQEEAINWARDERDPRRYYVYPPQPDPAGYVELVYTPAPPAVNDEKDELAVSEIYVPALVDYVLSWALSMETDAAQVEKAQSHYQRFVAAVTGQLSE